MISARWVSDKKQELPSLRDHMSSPPSFWWGLAILYFGAKAYSYPFCNFIQLYIIVFLKSTQMTSQLKINVILVFRL
jgi:hypothetical protein